MNQPKLPYILIAAVICLLAVTFWLGYQRSSALQLRDKQVEKRMDEWVSIIEIITKQQQRVIADISKTETEKKQIRMDVGKEIKTFNRTVKEIKQYKDPYESIEALNRAWATH